MFINPKLLLETKVITYPDSKINIDKHIQQNGIDIDCDRIWDLNFKSIPLVGVDVNAKPNPKELTPSNISFASKELKGKEVGWVLEKGKVYAFESSFDINIPEDMCGWVIGRSSFNRQGVLIRSGFFDAGFNNKIGATIYCFNNMVIEKNARIAQIVLAKGESASMYQGQYQS